jgi:hypothetical protein
MTAMARKIFYSFHYAPDNWRVSQVRNIGAIEDNKPAKDNDWETITKGGDKAIETWINEQMSGRSCVVVLIGAATANRKWINHEIEKAWNAKKGVVGVHIHNLKNSEGKISSKGDNPFDRFTLSNGTKKLSSVVKVYDPIGADSTAVYKHIKENLEKWIDEAVEIRGKN